MLSAEAHDQTPFSFVSSAIPKAHDVFACAVTCVDSSNCDCQSHVLEQVATYAKSVRVIGR